MAIIYDPTHPYQPGPAPAPGFASPGGNSTPQPFNGQQHPGFHGGGMVRQSQSFRNSFGSYSRFGMNQNFYNQFGGGLQSQTNNPYPGVIQFQGAGGGWPFQWQDRSYNFFGGVSPKTSV